MSLATFGSAACTPLETRPAADGRVEPIRIVRPAAFCPPCEAEVLLNLTGKVVASATPEQRQQIEQAEQSRFDTDPSYDNLLRLTLVRAYGAALPAELESTRDDLEILANGRHELTLAQRQLAMLALLMIDQRLEMGAQIADLRHQIDSLTEIEASLEDYEAGGPGESVP